MKDTVDSLLRDRKEDDHMYCMRCCGLMAEDHFFDFGATGAFMWMKGWRCMNCGYAVDPIMEANRRLHESASTRRSTLVDR